MGIHEEIEKVARDFYFQRGCQEGHDLENWLAAEDLVKTWHESFEEREKHVSHDSVELPLLSPGEDEVVH